MMMRQIKYALAGLMMLGATPQLAQAQVLSDSFPLPIACAEFDIGTPECPVETVREALSFASPRFVKPYHDAGLESFAILTMIGAFGTIFDTIASGEDCHRVFEELYFLGETVSFYLPDVNDLPEPVADEYRILHKFFGKAFRFAGPIADSGEC